MPARPKVGESGHSRLGEFLSSTSLQAFALDAHFSVEQMGFYVLGERDARYGVSGKAWFYSGLVVGGVSGYLLESSVWSLAVPPLFALTTKIPVISIKEEHISDQAMIGNEYYALGYEKQARSKNAIQALKGSALGTLLGIATFLIVDNN